MFGLKQSDIDVIINVMHAFPDVEQGIIFGSRAMGNYKKGSDIDIAIKGGAISSSTASKISYILNEESPLPYFFDIVHYGEITNVDLVDHIDRIGKVFYQKSSTLSTLIA